MNGDKVCPYCGRQAPGDTQSCAGCGQDISGVQPQGSYSETIRSGPGPGPATNGFGSRSQVQSAIQSRTEYDVIMPIWWIYLLLASMVVLIAGAILVAIESMDKTNTDAGAILLTIGFVFFAVVSILIYYQLVKRQNEHFKREAMERAAMVSWFRDRAQEMGRLQFIGPQLGAMESINQEAQFKEKELSIIFIILLIIPIVDIVVMLYLLYAFTKMPFEHDQRWHHFTQNAQMAGQQLGVNIMMPSWKTQSERSFVIYLVLTIIISVFMIYWLYVIIKDLNEHMKNQWAFEDQLLREMNR